TITSPKRERGIRSVPRSRLGLLNGLSDYGKRLLGRRLGELPHVLRDPHRAELRAAHRAEFRALEYFLRQLLVVHRAGGLGVERQFELAVPLELKAALAQP